MIEKVFGPLSFQRFVVLGVISTRSLIRLLAIQALVASGDSEYGDMIPITEANTRVQTIIRISQLDR